MPDDPTFENKDNVEDGQTPAAGDAPVQAEDISHPEDVGEGVQATEGVERSDAVAEAYDSNPVVQTFDKSAGDATVAAPDYGRVIPQGGSRSQRTDNDVEYPEREDIPTNPADVAAAETAPHVAPEPGEGVPAPVTAPEGGPSVVEGTRDTVPNPSGEPMSLQEQIDRGIGTPSPNVSTPGYDDEQEQNTVTLPKVEADLANGENNPQHGPVSPDAAAGAVEGPRDANPTADPVEVQPSSDEPKAGDPRDNPLAPQDPPKDDYPVKEDANPALTAEGQAESPAAE